MDLRIVVSIQDKMMILILIKLSKESIKNFIATNNLKKDKMTQYLLDTQKIKCYMLYKKKITLSNKKFG